MLVRARSLVNVATLAPAIGLLVACASEPTPVVSTPAQTSYRAWYGETCFEDDSGAPVAKQVASFQRAGASWATREYTDERGCMPSSGLVEGLYAVSIEGRAGAHDVYIADGDSIRVRFGGDRDGVEYEGGPSLSATILELVRAKDAPEPERQRLIADALGHPRGTRVHVVGLLASFELRGDWARGGEPTWDNHTGDDARRLLTRIDADSPWLTAWPTAPIGAALALGYSPNEHPAVHDMVEHDQTGPVAANLWLFELYAARTRGDDERADRIYEFLARTPAFEPYASMASAG